MDRIMCTHDPVCPAADAIDWWAARNITEHPSQGWTLLCNGALVFDDHGALLPDGRVAAISDRPCTVLRTVARTGGSSSVRGRRQPPISTARQMQAAKQPDNNARLRRSQSITEGG